MPNLKQMFFFILPIVANMGLFANHGSTFAIEEQSFGSDFKDFTEVEISQMQQKHKKEIEAYVKQPPEVKGLSEAKIYRAFYYDPIFRVKEDIKTLDGKIIAKEGDFVNALDHELYIKPSDLIFFDGSNAKHKDFAQKNPQAKWILVKGSPLNLEEEFDKDVYFDQGGMYCTKFGIEKVPAKVSIQGNRILIEEVPCED